MIMLHFLYWRCNTNQADEYKNYIHNVSKIDSAQYWILQHRSIINP